MIIQKADFETFDTIVKGKYQGIVLLGCGGELHEWVNGVTATLHKEKIIPKNDVKVWNEAFLLTTTGGRQDLALTFNENAKFNLEKMAMWRLLYGDCSWISDYRVNYWSQHFKY